MITSKLNIILGEKRMSRRKLSMEAGVSANAVERLYKDEGSSIDYSVLEKICKVLGCQPGDILKMEDDKQ